MGTMNNDHVMIDLETLDTKPGGVVLSAGLVRFDPTLGRVQDTEELREKSLKVVFDLNESISNGFTMSASTLKWWFRQSKQAQEASFFAQESSISDGLLKINNYLTRGDKVWGNGANFDIPLLEAYYNRRHLPLPWAYNKVRCHRTMVNTHLMHPAGHVPANVLAHDPVTDSIYQAQMLQSIAMGNPNIRWI